MPSGGPPRTWNSHLPCPNDGRCRSSSQRCTDSSHTPGEDPAGAERLLDTVLVRRSRLNGSTLPAASSPLTWPESRLVSRLLKPVKSRSLCESG